MKAQEILHNIFSFQNLLDMLHVENGDTVFLHTSFSRLKDFFEFPEQLLDALMQRLGMDGTLSMPRYVWHLCKDSRPWVGYSKYLDEKSVLDLRITPANIGVIPERFRHVAGVCIGISYFWPVTALGPNADAITCMQEAVVHPYGPGSSFHTLLDLNAKILGLGVSLNTSSIAPVSDWFIGESHRKRVFTSTPLTRHVIDLDGNQHAVNSYTLQSETVRDIKPSVVLDNVMNDDSILLHHDGSIYFCYPAKAYHKAALRMAIESQKIGSTPPWLPYERKP